MGKTERVGQVATKPKGKQTVGKTAKTTNSKSATNPSAKLKATTMKKAASTGGNGKVILSLKQYKQVQKSVPRVKAPSKPNNNQSNKAKNASNNPKTNPPANQKQAPSPAQKLKSALAAATALSVSGSGHPKRGDIKTLLDAHKKGFVNDQAFLNNLQKLVM